MSSCFLGLKDQSGPCDVPQDIAALFQCYVILICEGTFYFVAEYKFLESRELIPNYILAVYNREFLNFYSLFIIYALLL